MEVRLPVVALMEKSPAGSMLYVNLAFSPASRSCAFTVNTE